MGKPIHRRDTVAYDEPRSLHTLAFHESCNTHRQHIENCHADCTHDCHPWSVEVNSRYQRGRIHLELTSASVDKDCSSPMILLFVVHEIQTRQCSHVDLLAIESQHLSWSDFFQDCFRNDKKMNNKKRKNGSLSRSIAGSNRRFGSSSYGTDCNVTRL